MGKNLKNRQNLQILAKNHTFYELRRASYGPGQATLRQISLCHYY